jgi:PAS domain S-box-containing protein
MFRDPQARPSDARQGLAALIEALTMARSLTQLIEMIPTRVAAHLGCKRVLLYEVRDDALHMVSSTADVTMQGWSSTLLRFASIDSIPINDSQPEARALSGDAPLPVPGTADVPGRIIAPLHSLKGPVGALILIPSSDEPVWGTDGLRISQMALLGLKDVARVVGIVLDCARLLTENRQLSELMNTLTNLSTTFNNSVLDHEAAIVIVEHLVRYRITDVDRCSVVLDPMGTAQWLKPELVRGVMKLRMPVLLDEDHLRLWPLAPLLPENVRSFCTFPLIADNHVVGFLALGFHTSHTLDPVERNLLEMLANISSTVLQKSRVLADAERARQQARDAFERAQNEERLKGAIVRTITDGLLTVDLEGRVIWLNQQAATLLDLEEATAKGRPVEEVMPLLDAGPHILRTWQGVHARSRKRELHVHTRAGRDLTLIVTVTPLRTPDLKEFGAVCSFQDMTTMHAMKEELRRLETVSTMGMEAAQLSHDMRGLVNSVQMAIELILNSLGESEEARLTSIHVLKDLNRLTSLIENLQHLTRPVTLNLQHFDIGETIDHILRSLAQRAEMSRVTIERHFEPGVVVNADQSLISRAIQNLCINAIEAMPKGGKLSVTTRTMRASASAPEAVGAGAIGANQAGGNGPRAPSMPFEKGLETDLLTSDNQGLAVEIEIVDTGVGIPQDRLTEIWEPFKSFDKRGGSGLGLAIVHKVIDAHKGASSVVQSEVGRGTTFTIRLPATRAIER